MRKLMAKILCVLISVVCMFTVVGCYDTVDTVKIDNKRTQLYVATVTGSGFGRSWLDKAIKRFEEEYKDFEFEPGTGKKGAQVIVDNVDYGSKLGVSLKNERFTVIATSDVDYFDFVEKDMLYDITDIIAEDFDDTDKDGNAVQNSIQDKYISQDIANGFSVDGKIYALPFISGVGGISYDRDLFEEKGFFFLANDADKGDYTALKLSGKYMFQGELDKADRENYELSAGRDGLTGTYDDGLPATYEQFYALMEYIAKANITPISWSGHYHGSYLTELIGGLFIDNLGAQEMRKFYDVSGTTDKLVSSVNGGALSYMEETTLDKDNSYLFQKHEGKYQALDFLYNVIKTLKEKDPDIGYTNAFKDDIDHTMAQDNFLKSKQDAAINSTKFKRIAMFYDGTYWVNEARKTFQNMESDGLGVLDRKIGHMPFPHPTNENGAKAVNAIGTSTVVFMNSNLKAKQSKQLLIATEFLKFIHTRESLVEFTQDTSMIRPFKYEFNSEEAKLMSYFGKDLYYKQAGSELLITASTNNVFRKNYSYFKVSSDANWTSKISDTTYGNPSEAFKLGKTSTEYFNGLSTIYTSNYWKTEILG